MGIVTIEFMYPTKRTELYIVMFTNTARPLTLRSSPNYYDTFNEIKSYLIFIIRLLLEREKQQKVSLFAFNDEQGLISTNIGLCS